MALIANVAICYNSSLHDLCHMTDNRVAPFFFYLFGLNVSDIRTYLHLLQGSSCHSNG